MKRCSRCKEEKPYNEFHKSLSTKDGYKYMCKSCRQIDYAQRNSPEQLERIQLRNQNKKRCPSCGKVKLFSEFSNAPNRFDGLHGYCKSCRQEQDKQYRLEHPEESKRKAKLRMRKWRKNPENSEKNRKYVRSYFKSNREKCSDRQRRYRRTPYGRKKLLLQLHRRRDRMNSVENTLQSWHINLLLLIQKNTCPKCDKVFTQKNPYSLDHIIPVSIGGGLTLKNTQLLHRGCNSSKGTNIIQYRDDVSLYYSELT